MLNEIPADCRAMNYHSVPDCHTYLQSGTRVSSQAAKGLSISQQKSKQLVRRATSAGR